MSQGDRTRLRRIYPSYRQREIPVNLSGGGGTTIILSGNMSGDPDATYVVMSLTSSLSAERQLTMGSGLTMADGGPNSNVTLSIDNNIVATVSGTTFTKLSGSLQRTAGGLSYLVAAGIVSITTQSNGQIIISASATAGAAPTNASYLTLGTDATLSDERVLTAGGGVTLTDGGAGSAATLGINNAVIATVSGTTFTKLSGSLQRTSDNVSYLVGIGGTSITTQSNGQIFVSSSNPAPPGADKFASFIVVSATSSLDNERALTQGGGVTLTDGGAGSNITLGINNSVIATVTGTTFTQLSGSLQRLGSGITYLAGGGNVTVTTLSNGQILISGSGAAGASAPTTAQYLTLATDPGLSGERVFTPGTGLFATDAGADGNYTLAINNSVVATVSGTTFTGVVSASAGLSGSLQQVGPGLPYLLSQGGITITTLSNGQIILSGVSAAGGGGGAPTTAQYLTLATDANLSAERVFTPGTGLVATDAGANGNYTLGINNNTVATISGSTFTQLSGSLQRISADITFLAGAGGISVSTQSNGQVLVSGTIGAPIASSYLLTSADSTLPNERVLTAGTGIVATDAGAGSTLTLAIKDNIVATISGALFSGVVSASAGLSGSLQQVGPGLPYLLSQGGITITTQSNGQIIISGSSGGSGGGAPTDAQYLTLSANASLTGERVFTPGTGLTGTDAGANSTYTLAINNGVVATVSGTTFTQLSGSLQRTSSGLSYIVAGKGITVVSGTASSAGQIVVGFDDRVIATVSGTTFTGPVVASSGISGSLQRTNTGLSYLVAAGTISISSQSNGQIIISGSAPIFTSFADLNASYIVLGATSSLPNERVLTAGTGVIISDGGAGSAVTLGVNNNIVATVSGTTFTGVVSASSGLSGSLQQVGPGLPYLLSQGGITITTQSNGQIIISGSSGGAGGGGAPVDAQYLALASNPTLTGERVFTPGTGLSATDAGAGAAYTLGINNRVVATISGSTFTQLSGSLQRTSTGVSYLVAGSGITVVSGTASSAGQIVLGINNGVVATVSGGNFTGAVRISSASSVPTDHIFFVSGSRSVPVGNANRRVAVFGGDVIHSASITFFDNFPDTRSHIKLMNYDGTEFNVFTSEGATATMTWANPTWINNYTGYSVGIHGYSGGVTSYDGRNNLTTDLACVSQFLSADSTTTTSTTSQDSNLTFAVNSGEVWICEANLLVNCSGGAGGVKIGFSDPGGGGGTIVGYSDGCAADATLKTGAVISTFGAQGAFSTVDSVTNSARMSVVITAAAAGNITVQYASVTGGETTLLIAGSSLVARRVNGV